MLIESANWDDADNILEDPDIQIGLFGPPGVGKTTGCFRSGEKQGKKVYKVQCHSEMAPADVMGYSAPKKGEYIWVPGAGELAYRHGGLLILDEIAEASGSMKTYLYALLDRGPGGTITHVGRTFTQQPGYQAVATMNEDPSQGSLPEALLDRFDGWLLITQPHPTLLDLLDDDLREICSAFYQAAAEPPTDPGEVYDPLRGPSITFRMLMGFQKQRQILPIAKAALSVTRNNQDLARLLLETLALSADIDDDDDLEDDLEEEDD